MPKPLPVAPPRPYRWRPNRAPLPLVGVLQPAVAARLCGADSLYLVNALDLDAFEGTPGRWLAAGGVAPGGSMMGVTGPTLEGRHGGRKRRRLGARRSTATPGRRGSSSRPSRTRRALCILARA